MKKKDKKMWRGDISYPLQLAKIEASRNGSTIDFDTSLTIPDVHYLQYVLKASSCYGYDSITLNGDISLTYKA